MKSFLISGIDFLVLEIKDNLCWKNADFLPKV